MARGESERAVSVKEHIADMNANSRCGCFCQTDFPKGTIPTSFAAKAANRTGMVTRLKGKNAWVRKIMQGKRCDYTARAIITPNAALDVDQVGVPLEVACKLSRKVLVTRRNLHEMRKLVRSTSYPQAVALHRPDGKMLDLTHCDRANQIVRVGWTVERNLINGDRVIMNRQPSLHRLNMLGHRVWVHPFHTFMLNPVSQQQTHTCAHGRFFSVRFFTLYFSL